MKLKLTSDGNVVVRNGRPVYVGEDGEIAFDAADSVATIARLNTELVTARTDASKAASERNQLQSSLVAEKAGSRLAGSKTITEMLAVPIDIVQASLSDAFKLENGELVGYDKTGNKLYSRSNPGRVAQFDEAIQILISQHPHRDQILKGTRAAESQSNDRGDASGSKSLNRAAFEALPPTKQMEVIKGGTTIYD
jgi:hypothetical protein